MAVFDVGTIGDKPWFGFCMWVEVTKVNNGTKFTKCTMLLV